MTQSNYPRTAFELPESLSHSILPEDLSVLRAAYQKKDQQSFKIIAERYFSTWTTSLMGSDIQALKDLSLQDDLRVYVKSILIEDGREKRDLGHSSSAIHCWPRDENRFVQTDRIGVADLRDILKTLKLRPEIIIIRDYNIRDHVYKMEPSAALARSIFEGTDMAITHFGFRRDSSFNGEDAMVMTLALSPEHQGCGVGLSMLDTADLQLTQNLDSYWPDQVSHAPNLTQLKLRYERAWPTANLAEIVSLASPTLKSLAITGLPLSSSALFGLIPHSRESLISLSLSTIRLTDNASWGPLLLQIAQDCVALTSFYFCHLSVEAEVASSMKFKVTENDIPEQDRADLVLTMKGPPHQRRVNEVRYNGPNAASILKILAASTVNWGYLNANHDTIEV